MNLRDALLCIDCDEVFTAGERACNPRCPNCGSSIFATLACWVQTWKAFEKSEDGTNSVMPYGASKETGCTETSRPTSIAA